MKIINKVEELINKVIMGIVKSILSALNAITPSFVFKTINWCKNFFKQTKIKIKNTIKKVFLKILKKLRYYNELLFKKAEKARTYPYKEKIEEKKTSFIIYWHSKSKKQHLIDFFKYMFTMHRNVNLNQYTINRKYLGTFLFLISLTSAGVYFSLNKIYHAELNLRAPANYEQKIYRPDYARYEEKTLFVQNVAVPVILKGKKEIHSVVVDFTVRTTTVFAKVFLDNKQHLIKDRFYSSTYRIPASFSLQDEGKTILKEKVMRELNSLLKEQKVEGRVEDIRFVYNIAN